jgi:hypothetical protein
MFGREDKTIQKHIQARKVTRKISYAGITVIVLNYLINITYWISVRANGTILNELNIVDSWTFNYFPCVFLGIDCVLLFIGLIWICHSL